jgi:PAS domain S-box-containing protein
MGRIAITGADGAAVRQLGEQLAELGHDIAPPSSLERTASAGGEISVHLSTPDLEAELRRVKAEAAETDDLFSATFEQSAVGKVMLDMSGHIFRVNRAVCETLGYRPEELVGQLDDVFAHPDEIGQFDQQYHALIEGRIPSYQVRRRYRHKRGDWIPFALVVSLARDVAGDPRFIVAELQDLTEIHAAQAALEDSEARYRLLANVSPDIIVRYNLDGIVEYISPAAKNYGYDPEAMVGRDIREFLDPGDLKRNSGFVDHVAAGRTLTNGESTVWRVRTASGGQVIFEGRAVSVEDGCGRVVGGVAVVRDITDRVEMEKELRRKTAEAQAAAEAKSQFMANMSHELRTPLTAVVGFAGLLKKVADLPPNATRYADRIVQGSDALLLVVNDILDFSKLEAGQVVLEPHTFETRAFLEEAVDLVRESARRRGLELRLEIAPGAPRSVLADSGRVKQVLLNLLSNAVKFTRAGSITVTADYLDAQGRLRVEVRDTGIGIPAAQMDRLFQRFSQVDGSNTREFGGTGLGLAISRGLVELMGGSIEAESAPGVGSTFWFTIDAPLVSATAQPALQDELSDCALNGPTRLLLVDDVSTNRELVSTILAPFAIDIVEATGGADAVSAAMRTQFDVILMDLQMPGMDGVAATKAIRANSELNRATPILALSANVLPEQVEACLAAGMNAHISKPIHPAELLTKVAHWAGLDHGEPEAAPTTSRTGAGGAQTAP